MNLNDAGDKIISQFFKNKKETQKIVAIINEYKGYKRLDIRIYYLDQNGKTWKPTTKGFNIPVFMFNELEQMTKDIRKEIREMNY